MLFHLLTVSMAMKSRGFKLIKNTKSSNGFEARGQLIMEHEPRVQRAPRCAAQPVAEHNVQGWSRPPRSHRDLGARESIKAHALVQGQEDEVLKSHLTLNSNRPMRYKDIRKDIMDYAVNHRVWHRDIDQVAPVDVDA
eukprot:8164651-Pyramimonas_sp.AAC.1